MTSEELERRASTVEWTDLTAYLLARGWARADSRRTDIGVFRKELAEVVVPLDRGLGDFGEAIISVADRVATQERRGRDQVLTDFLSPRQDRLRVIRRSGADNTLPIDEGGALLAGARQALLAAACSVERPAERFHRRMSLRNAESFVERCRLGQTEEGSFVLTLLCPTTVPEEPTANFGRAAVEGLLRALAASVNAIRLGQRERLATADGGPPVITANLCEAVVRMMSSDDQGDLRVSASWSPVLPGPNIQATVTIDRDLLPVFEDLGQRLRPPVGPRHDLFIGRVVELRGEGNAAGQLEGEVTFQLHVGEELVRARGALGPEQYRVALEAHAEQRYVSLRGVLHPRPKLSLLDGVADLTGVAP